MARISSNFGNYVMPQLQLAIRGTQKAPSQSRKFDSGACRQPEWLWPKNSFTKPSMRPQNTSRSNTRKVFLMGPRDRRHFGSVSRTSQQPSIAGVVTMHGAFLIARTAGSIGNRLGSCPCLFVFWSGFYSCNQQAVGETIQLSHAAGLRYRFAQFASGDDSLSPWPKKQIDSDGNCMRTDIRVLAASEQR